MSAATAWLSDVVGVPAECFRRNLEDSQVVHRSAERRGFLSGCLIVYVPKSSRLYWEVEGVMDGIAAEGEQWRAAKM